MGPAASTWFKLRHMTQNTEIATAADLLVVELNDAALAAAIRNVPLVSIDLIIRNKNGEALLLLRKEKPAQNWYFVSGGRLLKNESIEVAFHRQLKLLGLSAPFDDARFCNAYEHKYSTNRFDSSGFGTHYLVLAYEIRIDDTRSFHLDQHHAAYRWLTDEEVLSNSEVHPYTKKYFKWRNSDEFLISISIIYETLMSHYIHFDEQLWSRTQLLIAIQGVAFLGISQINVLPPTILALGLFVTALITLAAWRLITIDPNNSRVNEEKMDDLATLLKMHRLVSPRLREETWKLLSGYWMVNSVVFVLLAINVLVGLMLVCDPKHLKDFLGIPPRESFALGISGLRTIEGSAAHCTRLTLAGQPEQQQAVLGPRHSDRLIRGNAAAASLEHDDRRCAEYRIGSHPRQRCCGLIGN